MKKINLRNLIRQKKSLFFPGAFNPFTAKLIENTGFDGVYISGAGLSNSMAVPDDGTLTIDDFLYFAKYIVKTVKIPVICDADTGFENMETTVNKYIEAGLSGMHIEDQVFPKRCGHLSGKEVISSEEMIEKVRKAVTIRDNTNPDFLLIARTDARGASNIAEDLQLKESISRGKAYLKAGADMIFPESLKNKNEFKIYRKKVDGLLFANMTEFGKTPFIKFREFKEIGYNIVIFPVTLFRYSAGKIMHALHILNEEGNQENLIEAMMKRNEINELLNYFPKRRN